MPDIATSASRLPRMSQITGVWRSSGRTEGTIRCYSRWTKRYRADRRRRGLDEVTDLTLPDVMDFARRFSSQGGIRLDLARDSARSALRAWSIALSYLGINVPEWDDLPAVASHPQHELIRAHLEFSRDHRSVCERTLSGEVKKIESFLGFMESKGLRITDLRPQDLDEYVANQADRYAYRTLESTCSILRVFLRGLHANGRLATDIAEYVTPPNPHRGARPPRALEWDEVCRLIDSIDCSSGIGCRDHAAFLTMAVYGMGSAEVCSLSLDDVDWDLGHLRLVRPKTGREIFLPLLPAVARTLAQYIRRARPRRAVTRKIFVQHAMPHPPLTSSAIRFAMRKHAARAGITRRPLGGHSLRFSHAVRQMEVGTSVKTISDILGHADTATTSIYINAAVERLRPLSLPVPRWR